MKVTKKVLEKFEREELEEKNLPGVITTIGKEKKYEYENLIARYLEDDDEYLRNETILVLGLMWKKHKYKQKFIEIMNNDPDNWCQYTASMCLGVLGMEHKDISIVPELLKVVRDESKDRNVRIEAYASILNIYGLHPRDTTFFAVYPIYPKQDIDWDFLDYIKSKNYKNIDIKRVRLPDKEKLKARKERLESRKKRKKRWKLF